MHDSLAAKLFEAVGCFRLGLKFEAEWVEKIPIDSRQTEKFKLQLASNSKPEMVCADTGLI